MCSRLRGLGATLASVTLDGRDVALLNWYLLAGLEPPAEGGHAATVGRGGHQAPEPVADPSRSPVLPEVTVGSDHPGSAGPIEEVHREADQLGLVPLVIVPGRCEWNRERRPGVTANDLAQWRRGSGVHVHPDG